MLFNITEYVTVFQRVECKSLRHLSATQQLADLSSNEIIIKFDVTKSSHNLIPSKLLNLRSLLYQSIGVSRYSET